MAALLKNQILKHLSKFTKNLSADKLNLSAIKGCCDVHNIELNEDVLTDLLELPIWMCLSRAVCNHISLKVQWMKLKTLPICLALDEVEVEIETCEDFRPTTRTQPNQTSNQNDSRKYGFADRVIDGMTVTINSVTVRFKSKVFNASLQLSRLMIESRTPNWKRNVDLRLTRIKDPNRGQILIFKHLEWQTLRFEAKAESNIVQTPLRLIANQASSRITIKKRLSDCSVIGARIMFIFDDLLWVLTDAQLLSALHFADYLGQLIKRAPRTKHFEDALVISHSPTFSTLKNMSSNSAQTAQSAVSRLFNQYDIIETSHHIFVSRIEVHLCDDLDPNNGRSLHPSLKEGGALQITISKLVIDVYPYQKVIANRNHWLRYSDPSSSRSNWISHHLETFYEKKSKGMPSQPTGVRPAVRTQTRTALSQLMSRVILVRLADYSVSCVTTNTTSKLKLNEKLIQTDKSAPLPDDMMAFYLEVNNYYYFDSSESVPDSTLFVHLAPLKVTFDSLTLLWMNAFQSNLHNAMVKLQDMLPIQEKQRMLTRIECLMPLICIKCPEYSEYSTLELKSARIVALNCETENYSFEGLDELMEEIGSSPFMYDRQSFPWLDSDLKLVSDEFFGNLTKLKSNENTAEIWTVRMEPFWIEFRTKKTNKFQSLLDPFPITLWAFASPPKTIETKDNSEPDLNIMVCISSTVKVQLNHSQYLFLMRFAEQMSEFGVQMDLDTVFIQKQQNSSKIELFKSISLVSVIPNIEIVLKLSEELQTSRSIGISPQHSTLDLSSPSIHQKVSIDSEMPTLIVDQNSIDKLLDSSLMPKSHSDSLLSGSSASFETNKSSQRSDFSNNKNDLISANTLQSASSLASIPTPNTHNKLQNASLVMFKKSPNSDVSSLRSYSTFNESAVTDSLLIDDDNRSIRSDLSGDSDQFVVVGFETMTQEEEDIFPMSRIETADEVKEDSNVDSPSEDSNSNCASYPASDTPLSVTLLQIKASNLNLVQQSKGFHSKIFMHLSNISLMEFIKMPFSEYQTFVNLRVVNKTNDQLIRSKSNETLSEVSLRLETYAKPEFKDELISILVNNIEATLHMDSVLLLTDFITDEEMTSVPPTHILLSKVCFTLIDDKVSTPPLALNIPHLYVERDKSNQLSLSPLSQNQISSSSAQTVKLLTPHLKLIERNEGIIDSRIGLRVNDMSETNINTNTNDHNQVLDQILKKNETLLQEIERIKRENIDLKTKLKFFQTNSK